MRANASLPRRSAASACRLCPRVCGANRLEGERGSAARAGSRASPPFPCIQARNRRFPACAARDDLFQPLQHEVLFCQNYPISQYGNGREMETETLAGEMLRLRNGSPQRQLRHPHPARSADAGGNFPGARKGFELPVVYNTNGYDAPKRWRSSTASSTSTCRREISLGGTCRDGFRHPDYAQHNETAIAEMVRQVGFLSVGDDGSPRGGSSSGIWSFRGGWGDRGGAGASVERHVRKFPCP